MSMLLRSSFSVFTSAFTVPTVTSGVGPWYSIPRICPPGSIVTTCVASSAFAVRSWAEPLPLSFRSRPVGPQP